MTPTSKTPAKQSLPFLLLLVTLLLSLFYSCKGGGGPSGGGTGGQGPNVTRQSVLNCLESELGMLEELPADTDHFLDRLDQSQVENCRPNHNELLAYSKAIIKKHAKLFN